MAITQTITQYRVQVTQIQTDYFDSTKECLVEERHYTDEEIQKNHNYMLSSVDTSKYFKKLYGTKPWIDNKKTEQEILNIIVNTLNMNTVINAIISLEK